MQSAIGVVQLDKLDAILERKEELAGRLTATLEQIEGIQPPITRADRSHPYMLYTTTLDEDVDRDRLLADLRSDGIEAKVYFPPVHLQPIFAEHKASLPVTESLAGRMLSLPIHSRLQPDELDRVTDAVRSCLARQLS
jgi:perosamine synthetase